MAQSGLARLTGGQKVAGSNPVAPTFADFFRVFCFDQFFGAWRSLV